MDALLLLVHGLGLALQLLCFVLDVNFWLVSTLLTVCLWAVAFVGSLPGAVLAGLACCWAAVLSSLQVMARSCSAGLEGLKVVGHLLGHLLGRSKEAVQRGFVSVELSGQALAQQTCDVCAIVVSLVTYLVNSLLNVGLLGAQCVGAVVLGLWDSFVIPFIRVTELLSAFMSHLSSSAIAMTILLWTPCQLILEMLASTTKVLLNLFFLNLYGLLLLTLLIIISTLLINPELTSRVVEQLSAYFNTLPSYRRLRHNIWRLYQGLLLSLEIVRSSEVWHRISATAIRIANWNTAMRRAPQQANRIEGLDPEATQDPQVALRPDQGQRAPLIDHQEPQRASTANLGRQRTLTAHQRLHAAPRAGPERRNAERNEGHHNIATEQRPIVEPTSNTIQQVQLASEEPGSSHSNPIRKQSLNASDNEQAYESIPWMLLKEQEDRKKCVICQDHNKTVLLLPCRHLCLCSECTDILLQQPVYQRSCPLCRQMILQTLTVYL
uniref:E3 ubiquitin-protein ligase RNF26 n=1 Tax=Geotrypetes seraphini TaxID=260995 RepID=A0A6P8PGB5_GEOSA|nr:E3 ubiquitin-protein ligase RNF26 [Geotrypetes seraphini]